MKIATNIEWDIDLEDGESYEEVKEEIGLPDKIMIPENITDEDEISDYVSEITGFCHYGFDLVEIEKENLCNQFAVVGYDKDNDVYIEYKLFQKRAIAESFAKELKKGIEKGTLTRKCSDGTLEPIDWVQVVDSEDFDKVFWTSYEQPKRDMSKFKNKRLEHLPVLSKKLADKILKVKKNKLEFFISQTKKMEEMTFPELTEFVQEHSEFIRGIGRDHVQKRMCIHFQLDSVLLVALYQNMDDKHVEFGNFFGVRDENKKLLGFYNSDEIDIMIIRAYKEFLKNAISIEYKGIVFDEWTIDDETIGIYSEICEYCAEKYKDILNEELSDGAMGSCSVKGCNIVGMDVDTDSHYYVDFKPELIHIHERKEGTANE